MSYSWLVCKIVAIGFNHITKAALSFYKHKWKEMKCIGCLKSSEKGDLRCFENSGFSPHCRFCGVCGPLKSQVSRFVTYYKVLWALKYVNEYILLKVVRRALHKLGKKVANEGSSWRKWNIARSVKSLILGLERWNKVLWDSEGPQRKKTLPIHRCIWVLKIRNSALHFRFRARECYVKSRVFGLETWNKVHSAPKRLKEGSSGSIESQRIVKCAQTSD